ncbi:hypothetical protein [Ekhidna sp.]|uniref:hypothetical protein n=1 Tax=Ekhidna sp. TaxID=2608089 RepID=UPI003299790B
MKRSFPSQNVLHLRDSQRSWYFNGIKGFSNSPEMTLRKLKSVIIEKKIDRIYTLGMCSGGFASLLYGHLLKANRIFCFSPQTILDGTIPSRYMSHLNRINRNYGDHPFINLCNLDLSNDNIDIYFDPHHERDSSHIRNLTGKWKAPNLFERQGGHFVARVMRSDGSLKQVLNPYLESRNAN